MAGFDSDFIQVRTDLKTGKPVQIISKFYDLVGSHTNRRSFCTNMHIHRGLPAELVMAFSQHKKKESFDNYIQATAQVKFDEFTRRIILSDRLNKQLA